jgi:amidase
MSDLEYTSATEQARLVRTKEVSPVELVEMYLRRIESIDPQLGSFVTVTPELALAEAEEAAAAVSSGGDLPPFHGVPIGIKDLMETKGVKTTFSCRALAEYVPDEDDNVVKKIKDAGFISLGKTNTSEFGSIPVTESDLNGACRNPWNTDRTAGGSSGGAAAAVAAGLLPVAHAADGGGSVRIPSSCCHLFGMKPSRGRISSGPRLHEHWHGFSTSGAIGRSVADVAGLLDAMQGYVLGDPYWAPPPERPYTEEVGRSPGRLKIAFTSTNPNEIPPSPEALAALEDAAGLFESLGHHIEERTPEWVDQSLAPSFIQLIATGTAIADFLPHDQLEPLNRYLMEQAAEISSVQHMHALVAAHAWARRFLGLWETYDVLLTPGLALPPVEIGWVRGVEDPFMQLVQSGMFMPYTPAANITGQPAASVPLWRDDTGLPLGVQLIGAPGREDVLFRLAAQLEEERPWAEDRAPLG